jgi:hypothetical protein
MFNVRLQIYGTAYVTAASDGRSTLGALCTLQEPHVMKHSDLNYDASQGNAVMSDC